MTLAVEGLQTSVHTHVLVSPIQFEPGTESSRWRANRLPLRQLFILLAFLGGGAGLVGVRQWREARREETGPKQNSDGGDGGPAFESSADVSIVVFYFFYPSISLSV